MERSIAEYLLLYLLWLLYGVLASFCTLTLSLLTIRELTTQNKKVLVTLIGGLGIVKPIIRAGDMLYLLIIRKVPTQYKKVLVYPNR